MRAWLGSKEADLSSRNRTRSEKAPKKDGGGGRRPGGRGRPRSGSGGKGRGRSTTASAGYLVPGERAVREILAAAAGRIRKIWIDDARRFETLRGLAEQAGVAVEIVEPEALVERAPEVDARGVLALAEPPPEVELPDLLEQAMAPRPGTDEDDSPAEIPGKTQPRRIIVALDQVLDPQNLGAIMRSCEFFGARGLLWAKDRAAGLSPAVVRASAGASERLPLCRVTNLAAALRSCKDAGMWVVGTVPDGGTSLRSLVLGDGLPDALVVVMGGEQLGLRRLTREHCDYLATIEGQGGVASLNVSAAAAVTLSWLR